MEKLFERQNKLNNRVSKLDNDMISLARTTLKSLDYFQNELLRQGEHIKHFTNRVKHVEMAMQHHEHQITDNKNSITFLGNMLGVLLSDLNRYLLLYESILSELDHFLDALDNLSNNQLSHSVVSADVMQVLITMYNRYLKWIILIMNLLFHRCMTITIYQYQLLHARIKLWWFIFLSISSLGIKNLCSCMTLEQFLYHIIWMRNWLMNQKVNTPIPKSNLQQGYWQWEATLKSIWIMINWFIV